MTAHIGVQLADAVEDLHAPVDLAARVIRRSRSLRRRRLATASLIAATGIAVAVVVPLATSTNSSGVSRLVPAAIPTSSEPTQSPAPPSFQSHATASVSGVEMTWVPAGLTPTGYIGSGVMNKDKDDGDGAPYVVTGVAASDAGANGPSIGLSVQRGFQADLNKFASEPGQTIKWLTVQGNRALFQDFGPCCGSTAERYQLTWVDPAKITIILTSDGPFTMAQLERVADGVVVHPAPTPPANIPAATAAIRATVQQVFTGSEPTATVLAGIVNGQQLAPALAELERKSPDLRRLTRVTVGTVSFEDASQAIAAFQLTTDQSGIKQTLQQSVDVELTASGWKINRADYCGILGGIVDSCPPK